MALSVTALASGASGVNADSYVTASVSPAADSLLVLFATSSISSGSPPAITVAGLSLTWTSRVDVVPTETIRRATMWTAQCGATPGSEAITITQTGSAGATWAVLQATGHDTTTPVVQTVTNSGTAATSGTATLAAGSHADNRPVSYFHHRTNEANTPATNWAELTDNSHGSSPVGSAVSQWRSDAFDTAASASWTTSAIWLGIAAELAVAGAGSTATPSAAVLAVTTPAVTPSASATVTPTAGALAASVPTPTASTSQTATPSTVALAAVVPAVTPAVSASATPSTVALAATVPAVTPAASSTVTPSTVALSATLPAPTTTVAVTASPASVTLAAVTPAVTTAVSATATPSAVALTAVTPTVTAAVSTAPSTVALAVTVPSVVTEVSTAVDVFTGTNGDPWASPWITAAFHGSGAVDIQGNRGRMAAGPGGIARAQYGTTSYADFDATITLSRANPTVAQYSAFGFRGDAWNGNNDGMVNAYHVSLRGPDSSVELTRVVDNGHTLLASTAWTFTQGVDYKVRVRAVGSALKVKIWDASGAQPGTWNVGEVTDATYTTGLLYLGTNHTASLSDIHWDEWQLTNLAPGGGAATPSTVALAVTAPAATASASVTVAPSSVALAAVTPAVTPAASAVATPGSVAALGAAVGSVTPSASSTATPSSIALAAALEAATGSGASTALPAGVAVVVTVPAPTVTGGSAETATPSTVAVAARVPPFSPQDVFVTQLPLLLAGLATVAPAEGSVAASATVQPGAVSVPAAVPAVVLAAASTAQPAGVALPAVLPVVTAAGSSTATPSPAALVASTEVATPAGSSTASPAELPLVAAVGSVTLSASSTAAPSSIALAIVLEAATGSGASTALPGGVAVAAAAGAATVSASATALPDVAVIVVTVPTPAASGGSAETATPAGVEIVVTVPTPAASGGLAGTATPASVRAVVRVPSFTSEQVFVEVTTTQLPLLLAGLTSLEPLLDGNGDPVHAPPEAFVLASSTAQPNTVASLAAAPPAALVASSAAQPDGVALAAAAPAATPVITGVASLAVVAVAVDVSAVDVTVINDVLLLLLGTAGILLVWRAATVTAAWAADAPVVADAAHEVLV